MRTPPELLPHGWTTTDLWCAPLVTGLYATLTHAQPFWAEFHAVLVGLLGGTDEYKGGVVDAMDPEMARAACAVVLSALFATRVARTFEVSWFKKGTYSYAVFVQALTHGLCSGDEPKIKTN